MSQAPASPWRIYRRLLRFVAPYRGVLLVALVGLLVEAAAAGAFTWLMKHVVDETFITRNDRLRLLLPLAIVGIFLLRGIAGYLTDTSMARAGRSIARDLRVEVLGKYLRLPGQRFDSEPVGSMLTRLGSDSDQVAQAAIDAGKVMLQQSLQVVAMLAVMLYYSWRVTLAILLLGPLLAWMMDTVGRRYRRIGHRIQESGGQLLQSADQALSNHQEVKVYGAQGTELARYRGQADHHLRLSLKVESTRSLSSAVVQLMGAVGLALLLFFAGIEAGHGRLTAGDFVSLMTSMLAIIPALKQLTTVQGMLHRGVASAERLFDVLDAEEEADTGTRPLARAQGLIEFRGVSARYPGQAEPALSDVSFAARPGTVTAIVGRSGSGKSTLIKLIPRFYEAEAGQILLDGHPLQEYRLADLRRQVALVGQQVMLFDGTVAANVAYGELQDAPAEALQRAVRGANASEFVERLPQGMETEIGSRGGRLSGGQRQRLAIARAMLKDAPILILDEATAALDAESERLVQDALEHLMPNRTTLVIAHRLSTIEHADQVLVLDKGRIVERGTHAELLELGGLYARLHRMQFREGE
ncbi:lipid A export permease/ATP-binding protein MsbA [Vulcaniibacterium tengchongense]|uniref:Subfamily B ATP-binding cassette protein MsbA n=1 Tax=Vulcaniibacterium tengchongense TaxID=1273429 RepID=A0A3N4W6Q9_9GAMM|nr:lipid A export permease/ATP-binding protein MsbA [Vulcaniibacterium tengchongense]RPE81770.1 subfamily B ATP-binding cassette protein MsbA [Vulcaniibacterium tengchongense]